MPLYEYYCRTCKSAFELLRPMSSSSQVATCPGGHAGSERTVSLFAAHAKDASGASTAVAGGGGGCAGCAGGACAGCGVQ